VTEEVRTGKERRMVLRLLEYWRDVRGTRVWPSVEGFDEETTPELWPFCFILDLAENRENPKVLRAGRTISSYVGDGLAGVRLADFEPNTLPRQAVAYIDEVLKKQVPVSRGGSFRDARGITVLYRSIVLPASEDDAKIASLVCAANCREVVTV
jgi:hypothetical protein